jgi:PPK2 family polyphosphate:nucleotide phosphotransferase
MIAQLNEPTRKQPVSNREQKGQRMFEAIESDYLVPFDGTFSIDGTLTRPPEGAPGKKESKEQLEEIVDELKDLQRMLYAQDKYALLLIFQAMDAAGKDGTIRAVMSGVNPVGIQVFSFKVPTPEEIDHDFLWRTTKRLPERGRIGIFNRSYYEEVLVVRVHTEYLTYQKLPYGVDLGTIWGERFKSILDHEEHLARNGMVILKFWLNVSKEEQRQRFLDRIKESEKNWKFAAHDVEERAHWDKYMHAYEEVLKSTSRPWAPWYAIPADNKPYMRMKVAEILEKTMKSLDLAYPTVGEEARKELIEMKKVLEEEK